MNPMTIKTSVSDEALSAAVAEHVAGYVLFPKTIEPPMSRLEVPEKWCYRDYKGTFYVGEPYTVHKNEMGLTWGYMWTRPKFATSADAVLPLLPKKGKGGFWTADGGYMGVRICIRDINGIIEQEALAPTFARAACFALLRAHGCDVVE